MKRLCLALCVGLLVPAASWAQEDPVHQELRDLRKKVLAAYKEGDFDKLAENLDSKVVVTWQNGTVTKGPKEIKEFSDKMTKGPNRVVEKSTIDPQPDDLALLYNDGKTAVAYGHSKDHYVLTDGTEFDQNTRWSATLVKEGDTWKVASIHISVDLFDNPILAIAIKKTATWTGAIAGGAGLLVGGLAGCLICRRKTVP